MHFGFLALDYPSSTSGGGVGSQIRVLARTLVKAGHRATVVALGENSSPLPTEDEGVQVYRVAPGHIHYYVSRFPGMDSLLATAIRELEYSKAIWNAVKAIQKREPFDLLEGTETGSVCAALWKRRVPLVIRLHGDPFTFYKYTPDLKVTPGLRLSRVIQRMALRRCRILISPSFSHLREISTELRGAHPPIEVIPNAVAGPNPKACESVEPRLQAIVASSAPMVLYVGRIEKCKGIPTLLRAAAKVRAAVPGCRFVFAGARHPTLRQSELDTLIDRLGIETSVNFLGHVSQDQLAHLYAKAAVTVVPSHYETFGLAALESMKYGVPVVATTAGSLPEVVADGETGLLVPPGDSPALADGLIRLLVDEELRHRLATNARQRAEQFLIDRQVTRNVEVYNSAASPDLHGDTDAEHIFFSAHPDDVVLSCGGFMASLAARQYKVQAITVFPETQDAVERESAYTHHLQAKWGMIFDRKLEDVRALKVLGVERFEQWNFTDAPWRTDAAGHPFYAAYEELLGPIAAGDAGTGDTLRSFVDVVVRTLPQSTTLYFPLSLGGHVDHRHLFRIGVWLRAIGRKVRFYEDWPYAEAYSYVTAPGWLSRTVLIDSRKKLEAIQQYKSQVAGLSEEQDELQRRMERFARKRGVHYSAERYWELSSSDAAAMDSAKVTMNPPFERTAVSPKLRDFSGFLRTLSWENLESFLPVGRGYCLDVGCGVGRHRPAIVGKGYQWLGTDRFVRADADTVSHADCHALPFRSKSMAAVVAWQVMEYASNPEAVISEAARVLQYGGVFCGSISFLEPLHGRSLWGISPLGIRSLLEAKEFKDVQITPGLSAFSLITWTWFRRFLGPWAGRFALPFMNFVLVPPMAVRFLASWLAYKLGCGTGHGMRWVTHQAPLEFAGQLVFVARKAAQQEA